MANFCDENNEETKDDKMSAGLQMKLLEKRKILIAEAVDSKTAHRVIAELLYMKALDSEKPVEIYVNSPGGEISSGMAIYDMIRHIDVPVTIIATGLCASIATIIFVAVPKPMRKSLPNTRFLIHQPLAGFKGTATELSIHANEILRTRKHINGLLSEACDQPIEKIDKDTNRDYWMTAEDALEYGLVGEITK